ncbi:MAG: Flp family type IVb pilin [Polyangiaceae bacterium]
MLGRNRNGLVRDKRGAVAVEYAMILVMFVVPTIGAVSYEGRVVYSQYKTARTLILLPVP